MRSTFLAPAFVPALVPLLVALVGCAADTDSGAPVDDDTMPVADTVEAELSIPLWPSAKAGALSISIDDNMPDDHAFWQALGARTGARFTWFVITDRVGRTGGGTWAGFRALAQAGHEIGSHSALLHDMRSPSGNTPCYGATLTGQRVVADYAASREAIRLGVGRAPTALAYPCGTPHVGEARSAGFAFARNVNGAGIVTPQRSALDLPSMTEGQVSVDAIVQKHTWGLTHFHYARDTQRAKAAQLLAEAAQKNVWVAPVSTVGKYVAERQAARARILEAVPTRVVFEVRDGLRDDLYDAPIDVEVAVRAPWRGASASQGGVPVPVVVERTSAGARVVVRVVPDRGPVVVSVAQSGC
ncbi:MAG: polysaccharide deacetylase family protein [Myxococcales bacterium]|nr:polysaccharide deacetylase family protein [Myxococcales bacterium]